MKSVHHGNLPQLLGRLSDLEELYLIGCSARHFKINQSIGLLLQTFSKLRVAVVGWFGTAVHLLLVLEETAQNLLLY